ncbi:MAG: c-type cytochrome [Gemmatimonadales bacterium]
MNSGRRPLRRCTSCHLADGGGLIGPNSHRFVLIHGGQPLEIMKTIVEGVADKGMLPWGKTLKPEQLKAVAAYVLTKGTTPKTPKALQGINVDSVAAAAGTTP